MQISNNFSVTGIDAARGVDRGLASKPQTSEPATAGISLPTDQLDLSPEALAVGATPEASEPFRADRVAELRQAIAQGDYDTDERLTEALSRMMDRLA